MPVTDDNFLHVCCPVRRVSSAPLYRTCSLERWRWRPQEEEEEEVVVMEQVGTQVENENSVECSRHRAFSLPSRPGEQRDNQGSEDFAGQDPRDFSNLLCRVRSFNQTPRGLVNQGDSYKRPSVQSLMSTGSTNSDLSGDLRPRTLSLTSDTSSSGTASVSGSSSCTPPSYFRVALLGSPGVGKTAIVRQFMTSEYRGTFDDVSTPEREETDKTVSVYLDGEESVIEFVDDPQNTDLESMRADGYVVVFSLADLESYRGAMDSVRRLRTELGLDRAILLVGNKVDLVRQRKVTLRDARLTSQQYECQYEETSAALNHHVDELLVSILTYIRHRLAPYPPPPCPLPQPPLSVPSAIKSRAPSPRRALSFLSKLFQQARKKAISCDNLLS